MTLKVDDPESPVFVETEVVDDSESEPEVEELGSEVVAALASLQEEISSWPTEPTMELVPSLAAMRALLSFRSPDVYDPL